MMLRAALLTVAIAAAIPATVSAATVEMSSFTITTRIGTSAIPVLKVTANPGERNDVTLRLEGDSAPGSTDAVTVVTDSSAPLIAGDRCVRRDEAIVCPSGSYVGVDLDLGDGDDQLTVAGAYTSVKARGGPGADRLDARQATSATLDGGDGDDVLLGGQSYNTLIGGLGADAISGGPGYDTVSYAERTTGVVVHLDGSVPAGAPGEGDTLTPDIEGALGGAGNDVLIGTDRRDFLRGNDGSDQVEGRGGDDDLRGDTGRGFVAPDVDVVLGGDGDDDISTVGHDARVDGGAGKDTITTIGPVAIDPGPGRDFVRALGGDATITAGADDGAVDLVRCTNGAARAVELGDGDFSDGCGRHVRQARPRPFALLAESPAVWDQPSLVAGLDLTCADVTRSRCAVRLSLRNVTTGRVLVAKRFSLAAGAHVPLDLQLPPNGVRRSDRLVDYVASMRAPSGEVQTLRWHAWIPRDKDRPTDGNGGRDAPSPLR